MGWRGHTVTINSVDMHIDGAWFLVDPTPLRQYGSDRGGDLTIPGSDGVTFRAKQRGLLRVLLELWVFGEVDHTTTSYATVEAGLRENLTYLQTNLLASAVGEVTVSWTWPDATVKSGAGYVRSIELAEQHPEAERHILDVALTSGRLA